MNNILSEMKNMINAKASNEQVNQLLNDKISKNEVLFYLSNKASTDDINNILEEKIGIKEFEEILNQINLIKNEKIDCDAFNSGIQEIKEILDNKSNSIDVINVLNTKVDKDEFNLELQRLEEKNKSNNLLKDNIDKIESEKIYEILNEKINNKDIKKFEEIEDILKSKADNNDFSLIKDAFQDMKIKMTQRIDDIDNDLDRLIDNIKSQFKSITEDMKKLDKNISGNGNIENINNIIKNKVDINDLEEIINSLKTNIFQSLDSFMKEIEIKQKNFEEKIITNIDGILKENKYIKENLNIQNKTIKDLFNNKNNYGNEMEELKFSEITKSISDYKLELKKDIENIINILNNKVDFKIMNEKLVKIDENTKIKINTLNEGQDNIILQVNNKIKEMYEDICKELSNKISITDAKLLLSDKTNNSEKNEDDSNINTKYLDDIKKELKQKLDINLFNKVVNQFNVNFENIKKDIHLENNDKDINKLLNTKISNDQFNKFIIDINKKLNEKVNNIDFTSALDNQAIINDTLCNENCIGRWFCKNGINKNNSYIISWDNQMVNTSPDNFIWEKDKTFILINEEGLYELNLSLYSEKRPTFQVVVNGEIIINNNQNNSTMNKKMIIQKNSESNNLIGLSVIEFIMLKKQSKLSVLFYGGKGTAFIGLKKL